MVPPGSESSRGKVGVDTYSLEGAGPREMMQRRSASQHADFFLPYLNAGTTLLDAGCGGGSITLGLAEATSPGAVVGLDVNSEQIAAATRLAAGAGLTNVRFQVGNVYDLPFPDGSFDAVFSHALLEHLSDPGRALGEFFRVLKPGAVVGVRNPDARGNLFEPAEEKALVQTLEWFTDLVKHNGGSEEIGSRIFDLLHSRGFVNMSGGAIFRSCGTPEAKRRYAQTVASICRESACATQLTELGWTDKATLEDRVKAWFKWAENPASFSAGAWVHAVAFKPD